MPSRLSPLSNHLNEHSQPVADAPALIGTAPEDVSGGDWQSAVHPDDRAGVEKAWAQAQTSDGRSADDNVTARDAEESERLYPLPPRAGSCYSRAIRTNEPELVPDAAFDQQVLPFIAADAFHLERLRKLDMYSDMVLPLVARGSTFGAITLVLH